MNYTVNIAQLTRQVFGFGYLPNYVSVPGGVPDFPAVQVLEVDPSAGQSLLGTPLFDVLDFYDREDNQVLTLSDAPIVSVSRPRNIVKTAIQGRSGTVKEFISNDDYRISVSGILAHNADKMPLDDLEKLMNFLNAETVYRVSSILLARYGIKNVVVDNIGETKPVDGFANLIQYSFTLLSDNPPEIAI